MSDSNTSGWTTTPDEPTLPARHSPELRRKDPPVNAKDEIRTLSATGFSLRGIAAHFGVVSETLNRWIDEDGELKNAFDVGRDQERYTLHNALYRKAMNGDSVAAMFLLKARHGYREGDQSEVANRVAITFNLPGAMKADEYKVLNADSNRTEPVSGALTFRTGRL